VKFDYQLYDLLNVPGYWYAGTPYSLYPEGLEQAFDDACRAAGYLLRQGVSVYCPIAELHPIAKAMNYNPRDGHFWKDALKDKLEASCGLIVVRMKSWELSRGLEHEIKETRRMKKPVVFIDPPTDLDLAA
jgi:Domain of unknown function (DUF1937)